MTIMKKTTWFVYSSKLDDMQKLVDSLRGYLEIVIFLLIFYVSTSFWVRAAPKSWSKYTTIAAVFDLLANIFGCGKNTICRSGFGARTPRSQVFIFVEFKLISHLSIQLVLLLCVAKHPIKQPFTKPY